MATKALLAFLIGMALGPLLFWLITLVIDSMDKADNED